MAPVSAASYIPTIVFNCVLSMFCPCLFLSYFLSVFLFATFAFIFSCFVPFDYFIHFSFVFDLNGLVSMF